MEKMIDEEKNVYSMLMVDFYVIKLKAVRNANGDGVGWVILPANYVSFTAITTGQKMYDDMYSVHVYCIKYCIYSLWFLQWYFHLV